MKTDLKLLWKSMRGPFHRVFWNRNKPIYFGRKKTERFDSPTGSFGVLYASPDPICSLLETIGRRKRFLAISKASLETHSVCTFQANRELQLVDLTGAGPKLLGYDGNISTDLNYTDAQRISQRLFIHRALPDGILYRARGDLSRFSVALFQRPSYSLIITGTIRVIDHPLLAKFRELYQFRGL